MIHNSFFFFYNKVNFSKQRPKDKEKQITQLGFFM